MFARFEKLSETRSNLGGSLGSGSRGGGRGSSLDSGLLLLLHGLRGSLGLGSSLENDQVR
jgi:hypothetical protein